MLWARALNRHKSLWGVLLMGWLQYLSQVPAIQKTKRLGVSGATTRRYGNSGAMENS